MKPLVLLLLGDGGTATSFGFQAFGGRLERELGVEVKVFYDSGRNVGAVVEAAILAGERPVALVGYSLGANGCAWAAAELKRRGRRVALVAGLDPTVPRWRGSCRAPSVTGMSFHVGRNQLARA